jgi:hypothetical protein
MESAMLVTKCVRDVQNMRNFSNNRHVKMLYSFLRWRRFNTSTFICTQRTYQHLFPSDFRNSVRREMREGKSVHRMKVQCVRVRSIYVSTLEFAARSLKNAPSLGPKWRFKAKQAAANFSLPMHQYGRSFPFFKMAFQG